MADFKRPSHNHTTTDIKEQGTCPACDAFLAEHPEYAPGRTREQARQDSDETQRAKLHATGVGLMNGFNRGRTDPSRMAVLGHDTATGFEFYIDKDGETIRVSVERDWAG